VRAKYYFGWTDIRTGAHTPHPLAHHKFVLCALCKEHVRVTRVQRCVRTERDVLAGAFHWNAEPTSL
jgi:hypothetical protein